jgi:hypothetical protein
VYHELALEKPVFPGNLLNEVEFFLRFVGAAANSGEGNRLVFTEDWRWSEGKKGGCENGWKYEVGLHGVFGWVGQVYDQPLRSDAPPNFSRLSQITNLRNIG